MFEHLACQRPSLELLQLDWQAERPDDELRVQVQPGGALPVRNGIVLRLVPPERQRVVGEPVRVAEHLQVGPGAVATPASRVEEEGTGVRSREKEVVVKAEVVAKPGTQLEDSFFGPSVLDVHEVMVERLVHQAERADQGAHTRWRTSGITDGNVAADGVAGMQAPTAFIE